VKKDLESNLISDIFEIDDDCDNESNDQNQ